MSTKLEVYRKLLRIQPWFQRPDKPVTGGRPRAYRTYRRVLLQRVDGGQLLVEIEPGSAPVS